METIQDIHSNMIKSAIEYFKNDNHTKIKADHLGYSYVQPLEISGQIPDITSFKSSTFYITEAETREGIGTQETIQQWLAFSRFCQINDRQFCAVVPKSYYNEAVKFAKDNNIIVNIWLTNDSY